jgi:hypothetical protein
MGMKLMLSGALVVNAALHMYSPSIPELKHLSFKCRYT